MTLSRIRTARDMRIARALWADARGAYEQADRNFDAADRWNRAYLAALAVDIHEEAAE